MSTVFNVYRITNLVNFKLYFGYTSKSIEKRWTVHKNSSMAGSEYLIHRAIRKWGKKAFTISLESSWPTEEQAKAEEVRLISHWQTNIYRYPDGMGYNMTDGGEGTKGPHNRSEESTSKRRQSHLGKTQSEECKAKRKATWAKRKQMGIGRMPTTEETKKRQSIAQRKRFENPYEREKLSKKLIGKPQRKVKKNQRVDQ